MRQLINRGWRFLKLNAGSELAEARASGDWQAVDIPHDWMIWDTAFFYADADGWYVREVTLEAGLRHALRFDGVYMDCDVLLDGELLATHHYGYTSFTVALPQRAAGSHELMVHIRHRGPNSRWYSGAGIFRDVWLLSAPGALLQPEDIYAPALPLERVPEDWRPLCEDAPWQVLVEVSGAEEPLTLALADPDGREIARAVLPAEERRRALPVREPRLWSCERPALYTLTVTGCGQEVAQRIGLRTADMLPDRGLLLNGQPLKLRGVCLHHDLGALGAAFYADGFRRQIHKMKEMGINALRTSHNPPDPKALDICDEEGILVVDEFTDMWERPKTTYDYARFFDADVEADTASWVRRDRNHACVILWSIGNEIFDTHVSSRGEEVTAMLMGYVERHDPLRHGRATIGSNYMPWEGARRCADILKIAGYNYGEKYYDEHHAAHPDWVIYGSETASALSSRGVYHFPRSANILSDEDEQCSALGNSISAWGTPDMRRCIIDDLNSPYSMGQFLWTGIDYIGEPTPYHTRNSYFGMMDTACLPKGYFWQVKALWNPAPMVHIGVHWSWNPGQLIDVPVYTNAAACELLLNGVSLGVRQVNVRVPEESLPLWQLPFDAGTLTARAYDAEGRLIAEDERRTFGDSHALRITSETEALQADGESLAFLQVSAVDAQGIPVENAVDRVRVTVRGCGRLMGLDNGDSTDTDEYKGTSRRLFSGRLLAIVGAGFESGTVTVRVEAEGLESAECTLPVRPAATARAASCVQTVPERTYADGLRPRQILLEREGSGPLTPDQPEAFFRVRLLPAGDPADVEYRIVNATGITSPCAEALPEAGGVRVRGLGDGEVWLRAIHRCGTQRARIISQMELQLRGFGSPNLDPYGFVTAGLYDLTDGEIGAGNEQGIAFARDGWSMVGFTHVDFGPVGSDEITIPIFALNADTYHIRLYMGDPREGGRLVTVLDYQKPSIWNTYQAMTWKLPERFTGLQTICFAMERKVHLKGFSFTRQSRAWQPQPACAADEIYGDSFRREADGVYGIGNNVSLVFHGMDFGDAQRVRLVIEGRTRLEVNPVQVRMTRGGEESTQQCLFCGNERGEQAFALTTPGGECTVSFVFLPGCQFDFFGFRFEREE